MEEFLFNFNISDFEIINFEASNERRRIISLDWIKRNTHSDKLFDKRPNYLLVDPRWPLPFECKSFTPTFQRFSNRIVHDSRDYRTQIDEKMRLWTVFFRSRIDLLCVTRIDVNRIEFNREKKILRRVNFFSLRSV